MLYEGRRLTATEACSMGLIDAVLWPSSFQEDLIPRVKALAAPSTQVRNVVFVAIRNYMYTQ